MSDMTHAQNMSTHDYEAMADQLLADIRLITDKMQRDRSEIERLRAETRKLAEVSARLANENKAVFARLKAIL